MREGPIKARLDIDESIEHSSNLSVTHRLAIFINTITEELMEKNNQLNIMLYKANHDALTGLLNRLAFTQEENRIKEKESGKYVLVQLDINFLKQVNDNYGHAEGDRFIIAAAELINDTFGRYGKCYRGTGQERHLYRRWCRC
jgi:GGDEF domain-containing protein